MMLTALNSTQDRLSLRRQTRFLSFAFLLRLVIKVELE